MIFAKNFEENDVQKAFFFIISFKILRKNYFKCSKYYFFHKTLGRCIILKIVGF